MFGVACHNMSVVRDLCCSVCSAYCVKFVFYPWHGPQVYTLKIDLHVIVYCSLVLAMTQVCGLEATIEGMKVTSQRRLTISKPLSPNVVFVCEADQLVLMLCVSPE